MNFGNFFRNISLDKQSEHVGGLFGNPSRLFESINAKTESIVTDISQKVDFGGKIDTLKKYSSIDKIGQSVLGAAYQSKPTNEYGDEKPKRDSVSQPQTYQSASETPASISSQEIEQSDKSPSSPLGQKSFEQTSTHQGLSRGNENEKSSAWLMGSTKSHFESTLSDIPANKSSYQDYSSQFNQKPDNPSYEYHPNRGYGFQDQKSENRMGPTKKPFQERCSESSFRQTVGENSSLNSSIKQPSTERENETENDRLPWNSLTKDSLTHEEDLFPEQDYKGTLQKETSYGSRKERKDLPPASESRSGDSFSTDAESFRKTSTELATQLKQLSFNSLTDTVKTQPIWRSEESYSASLDRELLDRNNSQSFASDSYSQLSQQSVTFEGRHENPFNEGMSFDILGIKKESSTITAAFKRQNTTPGPRPPRPPPPRSRSGSQTFQSNERVSVTDNPLKQLPSLIKEKPSSFEDETLEMEVMVKKKKSLGSQSSSEEIGYLTRLQCQEIVSAVDDMIAEAIDETRDFEPVNSEVGSYKMDSSMSQDYWRDSVSNEPEYDTVQNEPYGKECYYVTEPNDSETPTYQQEYKIPSDYQPPYEDQKNQEPSHYEDEIRETERDRSSPNADDWYTTYDSQRRNELQGEEEEEADQSTSRELDIQESAIESEDLMKPFIKAYVRVLVTGDEVDLETKNDTFREYMLTSKGRELFSKAIELEGACSGGLLDENGLRALLSRVVFVLTECQKTEDFVPSKRILTTSLVYHIKDPLKAGEKVFLFSYIKNQPIWHSLRFWNACFFQSVQETRAKMMDQMKSDMEIEQAITGQIKSYLNTMQVFNLHATMRHEFLRKQGDLFNLSRDDIETLSGMIDGADIT